MKTGIAYSEKYLQHNLGPGHPERPERLKSTIKSLTDNGILDKVELVDPPKAKISELKLAHDPHYIDKVRKLSKSGRMIDLDTPTNKDTFDLALLSAGGALELGQRITNHELNNGFALIRPPGHHATKNKGGGFCYFNNIAITARKLIKNKEINRVLIFDIDAHHGNGTQDIFYWNNDVLYISLHQSGKTLYPGSGFPKEIGDEEGKGFTVNIPFPPGSSDDSYTTALKEFFIPLSNQFDPDFIMVSTGLDAHARDPLTQLQLSSNGYELLTNTAIGQAKKICDGKILFVLEGGYTVEVVAESVSKTIETLLNYEPMTIPESKSSPHFDEIKENLKPYWDL